VDKQTQPMVFFGLLSPIPNSTKPQSDLSMLGAFIQLDDYGFPSLSTNGTHGFCGNFLVLLDDFGSPIFITQRKLMNLWKLLGLIG
jgi:hypothetical protein